MDWRPLRHEYKDDHANLPFEEYHGPTVDTNLDLNDDLQFADTKFYGQGKCKSLKPNPNLPTMPVDDIKNEKLRMALKQFGFSEMLQIQYVELMPNSWLPVHMDDWTYDSGRHIMTGPVQLYFVLSGNKKDINYAKRNCCWRWFIRFISRTYTHTKWCTSNIIGKKSFYDSICFWQCSDEMVSKE